MSTEMINDFTKVKGLSPSQRLVVYMLGQCHNASTGQCNPSVAYLVKVTSLSERTVQYALQDLEQLGHLDRNQKSGGTTHYLLHPRGAPPAPVHRLPPAPAAPQGCKTCSPPPQGLHPGGATVAPKRELKGNGNGIETPPSGQLPLPEAGDDAASPPKPNGKHRKPEPCGNADPRHREIIARWGEKFRQRHGMAYVMQGGRDGMALSRFLKQAPNLSVDEFFAVAAQAWEVSAKPFTRESKQAATLHGLCGNWNQIRAEIARHHRAGNGNSHTQAAQPESPKPKIPPMPREWNRTYSELNGGVKWRPIGGPDSTEEREWRELWAADQETARQIVALSNGKANPT